MLQNIPTQNFLDMQWAFQENSEGLVIEKFQEIPQSFRDSLRAQKADSLNTREGEYMRVASVPEAVVDKWIAEGFDFWNADAREIVAKLARENLDDFITTKKSV